MNAASLLLQVTTAVLDLVERARAGDPVAMAELRAIAERLEGCGDEQRLLRLALLHGCRP